VSAFFLFMNIHWQDILGQDSVKTILTKIVFSDKIPHAFLFNGPEGVGKDLFAFRFAEFLISSKVAPSNIEYVKKQVRSLSEPFIKYIFPLPRGKNETENSSSIEKLTPEQIQLIHDEIERKIKNPYYKISIPNASNIKINSIRDAKKFLSFEYDDIPFRFVIISNAHLMSEEAQNSLLKSLEEPPEKVIFILITSFPSFLRETIRSRCWTINFQPLNKSDLKTILINNFLIEKKIAEEVVPFAGGSTSNALNLIDNDFEKILEKTISILRYSFGKKISSALDEFSPFLNNGNSDSIKLILYLIICWLNDLQKLKINNNDYYFNNYFETLEKFNSKFPSISVYKTVSKLDRLSSLIQSNINLNLIVLNIVFELSALVDSK